MRDVGEAPTVGETDVLAVVRLLGEISAERAGHRSQVRRLMEGMAALIDAEAWTWSRITNPNPQLLPAWILELHGGFDDARFAAFVRAQEHPGMQELTAPFSEVMGREGRHLTSLRQWADVENRFPDSAAGALWREADLMPGILSAKPLPSGSVRAITLHRRADAALFSERDARVAHILLSEVDWLHDEAAGTPRSGVGVPVASPAHRAQPAHPRLLARPHGRAPRRVPPHGQRLRERDPPHFRGLFAVGTDEAVLWEMRD